MFLNAKEEEGGGGVSSNSLRLWRLVQVFPADSRSSDDFLTGQRVLGKFPTENV